MHGDRVRISKEMRLILREGAANKYADIFSHNCMLRYTSILKSFKCALEQKALLRVHRDSLLLREPKEWSVEGGKIDVEEIPAHRV
jgi:hypothetical protein